MASAADLSANIQNALKGYLDELRLAEQHWERAPVSSGEGEEAWNARQVAEHIAGAATFFGAGIATALGVPGPERRQPQFAAVADAVAGTESAHHALLGVVGGLSEEQIALEFEAPRFGKTTVANLAGIVAFHLTDHAGQLKKLREG
ncbi:DinB family protein [bacterium]|nr:MAG: DinB family protein [bacterium]MCL4230163.1 DinB family protein [Dehalococcoidia bacterium]